MANTEHLEILKQGPEVWNQWLNDNRHVFNRLGGVKLHGAKLTGLNLDKANLSETDFYNADFSLASLREVSFYNALLLQANFKGADLYKANCYRADLQAADLSGANLVDADLSCSNLSEVNLQGANLTRARLVASNLNRTLLDGADLSGATIGTSVLGGVNLSSVKGIDTIKHLGPSEIGIHTIYLSRGAIPEIFLRRAGVPDNFIKYAASLVGKAIEYYSAFISYSSKDQAFAERIYADLQNNNVRCWYAREDLKIGDRFRVGIDKSIHIHDKLLLILSKYSVTSDWVEKEVETAFEKERDTGQPVLFPIRIDDAVMEVKTGWPADIRRSRHIGDFREWKNHDEYQTAFNKLLEDLKAEEK